MLEGVNRPLENTVLEKRLRIFGKHPSFWSCNAFDFITMH